MKSTDLKVKYSTAFQKLPEKLRADSDIIYDDSTDSGLIWAKKKTGNFWNLIAWFDCEWYIIGTEI